MDKDGLLFIGTLDEHLFYFIYDSIYITYNYVGVSIIFRDCNLIKYCSDFNTARILPNLLYLFNIIIKNNPDDYPDYMEVYDMEDRHINNFILSGIII